MKAGSDPRTNQHPTGAGPDHDKTHPAPGGLGTGTKGDPAKHDGKQPEPEPAHDNADANG